MSRPSFGEGVLVAFAAALGASILHGGLWLVVPDVLAAGSTIVALGFGYLLYLLGRSRERAGRLVMLAIWGLTTVTVWFVVPGVWSQILAQAGLLWLIRALYHQATPLAALLDLGLVGMGLIAAGWAVSRTGSVFLAVWCLFLLQSLFSAIPELLGPGRGERVEPDPFDSAARAAERALRRLTPHDSTRTIQGDIR